MRVAIEVVSIPADWAQGRGAGHARNTIIVEQADRVVAFWDEESPGTRDTIGKARSQGKLHMVRGKDGRVIYRFAANQARHSA